MLSEYKYSRVMVHTAGLDAASIDINKLKESIGCTQLYILDYTSAEVYNETKELMPALFTLVSFTLCFPIWNRNFLVESVQNSIKPLRLVIKEALTKFTPCA